jgi:transcriptional regulator with XRE-family HTH domain
VSDADEGGEERAAVAKNVIAGRHKRGMSQVELSAASGVAQQQISLIEQGTANVTVRTLARIAHALGVEAASLLRRSGKD